MLVGQITEQIRNAMNINSQTLQRTPPPTWATSDYFLSSFLVARGMKVLGVDDSYPRRRFILHDPDPLKRDDLVTCYRMGMEDLVSATALFDAQKRLQRLLRDVGD